MEVSYFGTRQHLLPFNAEVYEDAGSVMCLDGKCFQCQKINRSCGKRKNGCVSFQLWNVVKWTTSTGSRSCSRGRLTEDTLITTQLHHEFQKLMEDEIKIHRKNFAERIIFMLLCNNIDWTMKDNSSLCAYSSRVSESCRKFHVGNFNVGQGDEKKWYIRNDDTEVRDAIVGIMEKNHVAILQFQVETQKVAKKQ